MKLHNFRVSKSSSFLLLLGYYYMAATIYIPVYIDAGFSLLGDWGKSPLTNRKFADSTPPRKIPLVGSPHQRLVSPTK